jgi:4-hydroxythreonine-4-phosphate dehydrogenase
MKVYITQGHESGIGLEVFFKSILLMDLRDVKNLCLIGFRDSVKKTLDQLGLPFKILEQSLDLCGTKLETRWLPQMEVSQSFSALREGMRLSEKGGVLFTLPTSKDQFPGFPGHTEYFRSFYRKPDLGMFFSSPDLQVLLISDHIALDKVSSTLTQEIIFDRLHRALKTFKEWQWPVESVLIAGFNPHAGEGGMIGKEDDRVREVVKKLQKKFKISGPYPGDTMLLEKKSPNDLLVYLYHDQGLGIFKGLQGFVGANITLGLGYPRVSPDHGTSFGLYGKNAADYRGCEFALKEALKLLNRNSHGKNSGNQGPST